jgi:hypothetical protein
MMEAISIIGKKAKVFTSAFFIVFVIIETLFRGSLAR